MYQAIVRRRARSIFRRVSEGDYEPILQSMADDLRHTYLGTHAGGGTRRSIDGVRLWFERTYRLFPGLRHDVKEILVRGGPWNTVVAVQWVGHVKSPKLEEALKFEGVHIVRFRWGRVTEIIAYPESGKLEAYCKRMAEQGVELAR